MLNNIINVMKKLEGKEVGEGTYFHHIYTNKVNDDTISTLEILESLKEYEISNQFAIYNYLEEEEEEILQVSFNEFCEIEEYEEIKSDNTYNWSAPISNHLNFRIYQSDLYEGIIVELSVHKYGDVRCNYTDECYLKFNYIDEFYEILLNSNKYFTISKDNIEYNIEINIFSDCPIIEKITEDEEEYIEGYEAYELLESLLNK